jgi:hypothetical protein
MTTVAKPVAVDVLPPLSTTCEASRNPLIVTMVDSTGGGASHSPKKHDWKSGLEEPQLVIR